MRIYLQRLGREPLIQFLVVGLFVFFLERWINAENYAYDQYTIVVDEQLLSQFMQQRAKRFNAQEARNALSALSDQQRQLLVDDFVQNEVLFREAVSLDLDRDDPIIRRRLIQKMDYLAQGFYDRAEPILRADMQAYYTENMEYYREPATITFTHVFFPHEKGTPNAAFEKAAITLRTLRDDNVEFDKSGLYGQRFLYNRNYVNRSDAEIESHFGADFKQRLFDTDNISQWQGPIESLYGWHLVLISNINPTFIPKLEDISDRVLVDVQRQRQLQVKREAIANLKGKYRVINSLDPQ
jgi:L-fucose mutarotase/ribose pyranase (RbsD/FucU family)